MTIDYRSLNLADVPDYTAIVLSDEKAEVQKTQWKELVEAFEICMQLEGQGVPMSAEVQRLYAASKALTTHINEQWSKHNAIRKYLKSWGYEQD